MTCEFKLVSYSSTITMMHGPKYIRSIKYFCYQTLLSIFLSKGGERGAYHFTHEENVSFAI